MAGPLIALGQVAGLPVWTTGLLMSAPQFVARAKTISESNDPAYKKQVSINQFTDTMNSGTDMLLAYLTGGKSTLIKRMVGIAVAGADGVIGQPFKYEVAQNVYDNTLNPEAQNIDRILPFSVQRVLANAGEKIPGFEAAAKQWNTQLTAKGLYQEAERVANQPGYYDPNSPDYWQTNLFGNPEARHALLAGELPPDQADALTTQLGIRMIQQANTGFVPPGFFETDEFKYLPVRDRVGIIEAYVRSNLTRQLTNDDKDLIASVTKENPDLSPILTGKYKDDPRFSDIRFAISQTVNDLTLTDILSMAGSQSDGSNQALQEMIMNHPIVKSLTIENIGSNPELQEQLKDAMTRSPELVNNILQMDQFKNMDLMDLITQSGASGSDAASGILPFIAELTASNVQVRGFVQGKVAALPTEQFVKVLSFGMDSQQGSETEGDDGYDQQSTPIPPVFRAIVEDDLRRRLQAGNAESDSIAYSLLPYMQQGLRHSQTGPHVQPDTARAFVNVLKRPSFWKQFDQKSMLQFCEFLNSSTGAKAFSAIDEKEREQWATDIKETVEPIVKTHMWESLKSGDIESFRRFMALKYKFADNPIAFYGTASALILGGIAVLGSLFSSDDEDDEEDDDEAYKKRLRKRLHMQELPDPDFYNDERVSYYE